MRAANTVASSSTSAGSANEMPTGAGNIQPVHRQLERPRRQIGVQPDAQPADDRDQWVPAVRQLAQHALDQSVDRRGRIVAQVAAGLPAALDDGRGADIRASSGFTVA